jgi:hypothetical protein
VTQNRKEKREKTGYVAAKNRKFFGKNGKAAGTKWAMMTKNMQKWGADPAKKGTKCKTDHATLQKEHLCPVVGES